MSVEKCKCCGYLTDFDLHLHTKLTIDEMIFSEQIKFYEFLMILAFRP